MMLTPCQMCTDVSPESPSGAWPDPGAFIQQIQPLRVHTPSRTLTGPSQNPLYGLLRFGFWMFCTMSVMLSDERKGSVEEASSPPRETSFKLALKRRWNYFHKPLLSILIGALVFGTGTAMSLLYFTQVGNVPYLVGPLFLSMGLMFLVTGLVWIPIIKQKMVHTAMSQMGHDRPLLPPRGSCATIS